MYFTIKVLVSALIIAAVSTIAKRSPAFAALITSLPLVSVLGMVWLWRDTRDPVRLADYVQGTLWYFLPSLPMFLLIPFMLRAGAPFWASLGSGIALTAVLYLATAAVLRRVGVFL